MVYDAKLGMHTFEAKQVVDATHPAVVLSMKVKANQGELPIGLIVTKDDNGELIPFERGSTKEPVGVLTNTVDTSKETVASVLVHGTVVAKALLVKQETTFQQANANEIAALKLIFAI